ncbi:MAG: MEKHLA domain-containing protein [Xenococcaceae cyanobacterium MO_167.B52]|nr:MEKHLA domain-containing protein [Xenococcaceae cyanobacterium MO_167.B52]
MSQPIWMQPEIISWSQILLDSFNQFLGYQLISRQKTAEKQSEILFKADFVIVSHGIESDPILNYGNQTALTLWEMNWSDFIQTPSRLTTEPINREARQAMLQQAKTQGYIDNYSGVRISKTGKRFFIETAIIWNLLDPKDNKCGQAATFSHWTNCS